MFLSRSAEIVARRDEVKRKKQELRDVSAENPLAFGGVT
jgi:hypothetical protein